MQRETSESPTDLAYAAGVIDSDGYIGVHRNTYAMRVRGDAKQAVYAPRVGVKQVTPQALDLLHDLFNGHRYNGKPTGNGRPLMVWQVHSAQAVRVCEALLPYLRIKREQALNAIAVGQLNASGDRRKFVIPEVDPNEPLLPLLEAARQAGRSPEVAYQSAHIGNIPCVRKGRRVFVPESYVPTWRDRAASASRRPDITERLDALYERAKQLNRVGV